MRFDAAGPLLVDFEGRAPVVFTSMSGASINNLDVTTVLRPIELPQFGVHQRADGSLLVRLRDLVVSDEVARALRGIFGPDQRIDFEAIRADEWKVVPYSRAV